MIFYFRYLMPRLLNYYHVFLSVFFFSVFLFLPFAASAQDIAPENKKQTFIEYEKEFSFLPGRNKGSEQISNDFLQILAEGSKKLRVYISYSFSALISVETHFTEDSVFLNVEVSKPSISGNHHYRDFDLASWLMPGSLRLYMDVDDSGGDLIKKVVIEDLNWKESSRSMVRRSYEREKLSRDMDTEEWVITKAEFYYPDSYAEKVGLLSESLSLYYASTAKIRDVRRMISTLTLRKPENLVLQEFTLCEAEHLLAEMKSSSLCFLPDSVGEDPLSVKSEINSVSVELANLRKQFNFSLSRIDSLLYRKGIQLSHEGKQDSARLFFERVLTYNAMHIPARSALVRYDLKDDHSEMALKRMEYFSQDFGLPNIFKDSAQVILSTIYDHQTQKSMNLMEDGRFLDATNLLKRLDEFCAGSFIWSCPSSLDDFLSMAHYGMYRSYLSVAQRAFQSGNYSFSVEYAENALDYAGKHEAYIDDISNLYDLLQKVHEGYLENVDFFSEGKDFASALKSLDDAIALCENYPQLNCDQDLLSQKEILTESLRSPENVFMQFDISRLAKTEDQSERNIQKIREKIRDDLSEGHLKAWGGSVEQARDILKEVIENTLYYNLRNDSLIYRRILSLTHLIQDEECNLNLQKSEKVLAEVQNHLKNEDYLRAKENYDALVVVNNQSIHCPWSMDSVIRALSHIEMLAGYQQLLHEAQSSYFRGARSGFEMFFLKYQKATEFYHHNLLAEYNLNHESLFDFASSSSNSSLIRQLVSYYSQNKAHENAFKMLKLLKKMRLDARELKDIQEESGMLAAQDIARQQPVPDPKSYVGTLTEGDEWFRFYERSFLKNWP